MTMTTNTRPVLPNKAYDSEYATQFRKEYLYLQECGIEPAFIKRTGEYRIKTYKYTKTPELFRAVADFYESQRNAKQFDALKQAVDNAAALQGVLEIVSGTADVMQDGVAN